MSTYMKNIKLNYLFLIKDINITQGIWMLYLASHGLSFFEIGSLEAIFHITSFIMETPTGAVADLFGRKTSRMICIVLAILSSAIIVLSSTFIGFAAGFVMSALSYNFESGAGEAMIYDSLLAEGQEKRFMKISGNLEIGYQSISIVGMLVGGLLGNIEYQYVYYAAILFSIVGLVVGAFFKEPPISDKSIHEKPQRFFTAIKQQYIDSFKIIKSNPKLAYIVIFTSMVFAGGVMSFYYIQLSLQTIGYTPFKIGLFLVVATIFAVLGAAVAPKADKRFGERKLINTMAMLITLSVIFCYFTKFSIIAMAVASFADALLFVATRDYVNKLIPSSKRATILSFESMMFSFCMIAIFPLFGLISDHIGIPITFLVVGGALLVLTIIGIRIRLNEPIQEN